MLGWWKTRSLIVIKVICFSYLFVLIVFVLRIINIGFPPFLGFMSEILIFKALIINKVILIVLIFSILFSCYYNIYLFWCFNGVRGIIFKINLFRLDLFVCLFLGLVLNFF